MIVTLKELPDTLRKGCRLLALDLGEKTIGLALADPGLTVATPLETIRRTKFTQDAIALDRIIAERRVGGLVIGLPINMDGSEGPRCQSTRQFAANLMSRGFELPVAFWDERPFDEGIDESIAAFRRSYADGTPGRLMGEFLDARQKRKKPA